MKRKVTKAIVLIASLVLLLSTILPVSVTAATPNLGTLIVAAAGSYAESPIQLVSTTTTYAVETPKGSTILGVKAVPKNEGDTVTVTIDGTAYPKTGEAYTDSSVSSAKGISTVGKDNSVIVVAITEAGKTTPYVTYTINVTKTWERETKFFNDFIAAATEGEADPAAALQSFLSSPMFTSYYTRFTALPNEFKLKVEHRSWLGAVDAVVKTGTSTLNVDTVVFDKDGNGSIELPKGASGFSIASVSAVTEGVSFTVGTNTFAAGAFATPKLPVASASTVTVTKGTSQYTLTVSFTDGAETAYLKKLLDNFYINDDGIESITGVPSFVLDDRVNASTEKAALQSYEAGLINQLLDSHRTANTTVSADALTALKVRFAALPTAAKALVSTQNTALLTAVTESTTTLAATTVTEADEETTTQAGEEATTADTTAAVTTVSNDSDDAPDTGNLTFPVIAVILIAFSAGLVVLVSGRKKNTARK
ncbi:MAG: hypothetical protein BGN88_08470 [Clostridiales bacterium 43-6]|nr:MAG: hypothetical protein BGN88_08470 [Clostridiales bacterium 43-6]